MRTVTVTEPSSRSSDVTLRRVLGAKLGRVIPAIATGHVWVNDAGGGITRPKFTYKLAWFDRLVEHAAELLVQDAGRSRRRLQRCADRFRHLRYTGTRYSWMVAGSSSTQDTTILALDVS